MEGSTSRGNNPHKTTIMSSKNIKWLCGMDGNKIRHEDKCSA